MIHSRILFASMHFSNAIHVATGHFANAIHGSACAKCNIFRQIMTQVLCLLEHERFSNVMLRLYLFQSSNFTLFQNLRLVILIAGRTRPNIVWKLQFLI